MTVRVYEAVDEFLSVAAPVLRTHESTASLLLGICKSLEAGRQYGEGEPLLAVVWDGAAPEVFAVRTPPHNLVLFAVEAVADQFAKLATALHDREHRLPGCHGTLPVAEGFSAAWCRQTGQTPRIAMRQKVFRLDAVIAPSPVPGRCREATTADLDWLVGWAEAFQREAVPGRLHRDPRPTVEWMISRRSLWIWEDGVPVSIAAGMRPTVHGMAIGLVYTPPEHRGRGYASNCVAAVSQRYLDQGYDFCTLFTDLANPTSNKIYQQIGFRPIAEFRQIDFLDPPA